MTYDDGLLVCSLGFVALLFLLIGAIVLWDWCVYLWNRNRWLRHYGQQPDPPPPPIGDYCDGCHRPIPHGETVWMDTRTGRILHVRCYEAERDETAMIEVKADIRAGCPTCGGSGTVQGCFCPTCMVPGRRS